MQDFPVLRFSSIYFYKEKEVFWHGSSKEKDVEGKKR